MKTDAAAHPHQGASDNPENTHTESV
jgi:hypothetical protein